MRTARKIRQPMYYANLCEKIPIYEKDSEGNVMYREMPDGTSIPLTTGETKQGYNKPTEFDNSITATLTEDELKAFGGEKKAIAKMTYPKGKYPFQTGTLVWKQSEVEYDTEGNVNPKSADYCVMGVLDDGRTFNRAIMEKNTKGGAHDD